MIAADFTAYIESRFPCVQGVYRNRCQTGELYVILGTENSDHPWSHPVGESIPGVIRECAVATSYPTEHEACLAAIGAFSLYEGHWRENHPGKHPVCYWRYDSPHCFWDEDSAGKRRGRLRVRLVLSDRPVVEETDEQYDAVRRSELERSLITDRLG